MLLLVILPVVLDGTGEGCKRGRMNRGFKPLFYSGCALAAATAYNTAIGYLTETPPFESGMEMVYLRSCAKNTLFQKLSYKTFPQRVLKIAIN